MFTWGNICFLRHLKSLRREQTRNSLLNNQRQQKQVSVVPSHYPTNPLWMATKSPRNAKLGKCLSKHWSPLALWLRLQSAALAGGSSDAFPAPRAVPDCFILLQGHFNCNKPTLTPLEGAGGLLLLHSRLNKCSLQLHLLLMPSLDWSRRQQVLEHQTPAGCSNRNSDGLFPPALLQKQVNTSCIFPQLLLTQEI